MRKKVTKSNFLSDLFLSCCIHECFCELLGGINQSACLLWELAIILLIHQYGIFPWPSPIREHYCILWLCTLAIFKPDPTVHAAKRHIILFNQQIYH